MTTTSCPRCGDAATFTGDRRMADVSAREWQRDHARTCPKGPVGSRRDTGPTQPGRSTS